MKNTDGFKGAVPQTPHYQQPPTGPAAPRFDFAQPHNPLPLSTSAAGEKF